MLRLYQTTKSNLRPSANKQLILGPEWPRRWGVLLGLLINWSLTPKILKIQSNTCFPISWFAQPQKSHRRSPTIIPDNWLVVVSHTKGTYTSRELFQEAIWIKIQWSCPNFLTFRTSRPRLSRSDHSSSLKGRSTKITRELWTIIVTNKNNSKVGSIEGRRSKTNWWIFLSTSRKEIFKRNLRTFRTRSNSWTRRKRSGLSNWTSSKVVSRTKIWRVWRNRGKNWRGKIKK